MSDLLPCPFCGGEARIVEGEESAYVQCLKVKMHRAMFFNGDNDAANVVAEEWNRRAIPATKAESRRIEDASDARAERDALRAKVARMEGALKGARWRMKQYNYQAMQPELAEIDAALNDGGKDG